MRLCCVIFDLCVIELSRVCICFFFQAEDGIRDLVRSRGLGDVYKRQLPAVPGQWAPYRKLWCPIDFTSLPSKLGTQWAKPCLLYTSDAADERSSVDLGGRRIIKKKQKTAREPRTVTQAIYEQ